MEWGTLLAKKEQNGVAIEKKREPIPRSVWTLTNGADFFDLLDRKTSEEKKKK